MKHLHINIAVTLLCSFVLAHNIHAEDTAVSDTQSSSKTTWQDEATRRLKGIYDRKEFRAAEFQSTWLRDSSGYTVREGNSQWRYDVRSGERSEAKPNKDHGKRRSPDGKLHLESRGGRLFVRDVESGEKTELLKAAAGRDVSSLAAALLRTCPIILRLLVPNHCKTKNPN